MIISARLASSFLILLCSSSGTFAACNRLFDPACDAAKAIGRASKETGKIIEKGVNDTGRTTEKAVHDTGKSIEKGAHDVGYSGTKSATESKAVVAVRAGVKPLLPVRAYLRADQIPPSGAGAYGLVVLHSRPTAANRAKLTMVCKSFVAHFPRKETAKALLSDQMITVWPLDNPGAKKAKKDDCDYALDHYDLVASEAAISDAQRQRANFEGSGPYLVGWSPSKARGVPDELVLVVDMSADSSQAEIDSKFLFWKTKIIDDPSVWRNGFSIERLRVAIQIFADRYGQSILDAIKVIGDQKPSLK
jgi:hypothetical protein